MPKRLTHVDSAGALRMVDVGAKPATRRFAVAEAELRMARATWRTIRRGAVGKGNVLEAARLAGIHAAKQTATLIPLCHSVALTKVSVDFAFGRPGTLMLFARAEAVDRTGVEMEALVAASVSALTLYDMCKAIDRGMEIRRIRLLEKAGGRSGHFRATAAQRHRDKRGE